MIINDAVQQAIIQVDFKLSLSLSACIAYGSPGIRSSKLRKPISDHTARFHPFRFN